MDFDLSQTSLILKKGRSLPLRSTRAMQVLVVWGRVWMTQEGDRRDYVFSAGESIAVGASGLTLISALEDAALALLESENEAITLVGRESSTSGVSRPTNANAQDRTSKVVSTSATLGYPGGEELIDHLARAKKLRAHYVGALFRRLGRSVSRIGQGLREVLRAASFRAQARAARG